MVPAGLRAAQKKKQASENVEQVKNNLGSFFANNLKERATLNKCRCCSTIANCVWQIPDAYKGNTYTNQKVKKGKEAEKVLH